MDFSIPKDLVDYLAKIDAFVEAEIKPLQAQDDNERFFDHRREWARTDFDNDGLPRPEWEALLEKAKALADKAGFFRFSLPKEFGGQGGGNLWMAVIREHLATQGLGLHNDLQNEHSIVGNFPFIVMLREFGTPGAEGEIHPRLAGAQDPRHLRPDRAEPRLRRHPHGDPRGARDPRRRRRLADQRREDVDHRHAHRAAIAACSPAPAARTATPRASPLSRAGQTRRA